MSEFTEREVELARLAGVHTGTVKERSRIIKLLEEHMPNSSDHDFVGCECEYPTNNWYNNHLVALIKGEK